MQPAWPTQWIAFQHAVFRVRNSCTLGSLAFGFRRIEQLLSIGRQSRSVLWRDFVTGQLLVEYVGEGFDNIAIGFKISDTGRPAVPNSTQVTRIVWHAHGVILCLIFLLLRRQTVRTGFPTRRRQFGLSECCDR